MSSSLARLNVYRALSSPSYIVQSSPDPILAAFELSQELTENGDIERHFVVSMSSTVTHVVSSYFLFIKCPITFYPLCGRAVACTHNTRNPHIYTYTHVHIQICIHT